MPFRVPFAHSEERFVSAVYVFNTGDITENAQTQILYSLLHQERTNTHFYTGDQLEIIAKSTGRQYDITTKSRLQALHTQLGLNIHIWNTHLEWMTADYEMPTWDVRAPFLYAIESFLAQPMFATLISSETIYNIYQRATVISEISKRHYRSMIGPTQERRQQDLKVLKEFCELAIGDAHTVRNQISAALFALMPEVI